MKRLAWVAAAFFALAWTITSSAQSPYPQRPITIVVIATGGAPDLFARLLAPKLEAELGQPVVIEARPGAGGNIAAAFVARAAPDGYTLLMHSALLAIGPHLYKNLPFNPTADLLPLAQVATTQMVVLVNSALPVQTLQDFVHYAKASPQSLNYGSAGNGTIVHMAVELFKRRAGIDLNHIPYKGSAPELMALLAGDISMTIDVLPVALPQIRGGKLKALAVAGHDRTQLLPTVPTAKEAGIDGFEVNSWNGIFVPAKTPPAIVARLSSAIEKAMSEPNVKQRILELGADPTYVDAEGFAKFFQSENQKWGRIVKEADIRAD